MQPVRPVRTDFVAMIVADEVLPVKPRTSAFDDEIVEVAIDTSACVVCPPNRINVPVADHVLPARNMETWETEVSASFPRIAKEPLPSRGLLRATPEDEVTLRTKLPEIVSATLRKPPYVRTPTTSTTETNVFPPSRRTLTPAPLAVILEDAPVIKMVPPFQMPAIEISELDLDWVIMDEFTQLSDDAVKSPATLNAGTADDCNTDPSVMTMLTLVNEPLTLME